MSKLKDDSGNTLPVTTTPEMYTLSDIFQIHSYLLWNAKLPCECSDGLIADTTIETWIALLGHQDFGV